MERIIVVGLGKSGLSIIDILKNNKSIEIIGYDSKENKELLNKYKDDKNVSFVFGTNPTGDEQVNRVYISPGVPMDCDFVNKFISREIEVTNDIQLAFEIAKDSDFIGITGTNGKTTTTTLLGEIIKKHKENTYIVGNIGNPPLQCLMNNDSNLTFVTELSSFQLEAITNFRPKIAAVLNITQDHLERHKTMDNYVKAKLRITENQVESDFLILNKDDSLLKKSNIITKAKKVYFSTKEKLENGVYFDRDTGDLICALDNEKTVIINKKDIKLLGMHNIENILCAIAISKCYGVDNEIIFKAISEFEPIEHRLQTVKIVKGVRYINDSKATNPDSAIKAIESIEEPIILIAGGYDKKVSFDDFVKSLKNVKQLILFGECKNQIYDTCKKYNFNAVQIVDNLKEAVNSAYDIAKDGDSVLLSPGCASLDMYKSYKDRGNEFIKLVTSL